MEISRLDDEFINKKKKKSAQNYMNMDSPLLVSFYYGWEAAIRFAKKVEKAEAICIQCGKLLNEGEVMYDQGYEPFCKKCYEKVFVNKN